ncbi:MAG: S1 family peptidase [Rudaea sp.]|uniref:S1 family peptidase n=1 Tax=Rudaea sp. TaxID=2136325 RepID=UPI0039E5AE3E
MKSGLQRTTLPTADRGQSNARRHAMKRSNLSASIFLGLVASAGSAHATSVQYAPDVLTQVEKLYGISEDAAISRLAKEYEAAEQARSIEALQLPGYAGSWFDAATQNLHVATASKDDFSAIEQTGATPVLVAHGLAELEATRKDFGDTLVSTVGSKNVQKSYVDVATNAVVFGIKQNVLEQAQALVKLRADSDVSIQLQPEAVDLGFSSNLLGADGTQNASWHSQDGETYPCSVGASAEKVSGSSYTAGFATAGHCNVVGNSISTIGGTSLGTTMQSTMYADSSAFGFGFSYNEDGAWVATNSGWTPKAQIDGYSSGTLNVSSTWAGLLAATAGSTACRYGEASGGPHCAAITARNVSLNLVGFWFYGMIEVDGICTNDGDSGGPLVTPSNQVQGTVTGGTENSCPDSSGDVVYFQPIATTLNRASSVLNKPVAMLTSHGRSAPTVSGYLCPDSANSGANKYVCSFTNYDSQGSTTTTWTTNTSSSTPSSAATLRGTCTTGQTVNVSLALVDPYGTTNQSSSFPCPTNPLP